MTTTNTLAWQYYAVRGRGWTEGSQTIRITDSLTKENLGLGYVSVIGSSLPGWRDRLRRGLDASTYYFRDGWELIAPGYSSADFHTTGHPTDYLTSSVRYTYPIPNLRSFASDSTTSDIALARIKNRLRSETNQANLMAPVAELRDLRLTINGITKLATSAFQTLVTIKRTKGRSAYKYAANAWLTFNFGLRPMVKDFQSALAAIDAWLMRYDHTVRLSGSATKTWISQLPESYTLLGGIGHYLAGIHYSGYIIHRLSYKYIGGFTFPVTSANDYGLHEQLGFTPKALIPTAWELVPYSWAADYFATIGPYLDDTFIGAPGSTKFLVQDKKYTAEVVTKLYHAPSGGSVMSNHVPGSGRLRYFLFERTPLAALPHSALRFRSFDELGFSGVNKLLNLASVLVQKH